MARDTAVLHRQSRKRPPMAVRGEGVYLYDDSGKAYLDGSGGAAVSCLGHGHPAIVAAIKQQLDSLAYAHTSFFTNEPAETLARHLIERAPGDLAQVYFVSGGSEANETALKLIRQYFVEIGQPQRRRVIARKMSYHGNTLGALAAGGNLKRRELYAPLLVEHEFVEPCYAYRHQAPGESEEAYGLRAAASLEEAILRLGPESVMCFIAETVVGSTIGVAPAVPGYLKKVREICDRYGVLLLLDEVMCGMGRTGHLYACSEDGVAPDILTCAKGIGGGYMPLGAVLVSERIVAAIEAGSGFFEHGFTYIGHATACAAGLAVQRTIEAEGLLENVKTRGEELRQALTERFGNHHHVGDVRGRGLFVGVELVADRASKAPVPGSRKLGAAVKRLAMEEGLLCYPSDGTADGHDGASILLAPPFIYESAHVEELVDKLGRAVDRALEATA